MSQPPRGYVTMMASIASVRSIDSIASLRPGRSGTTLFLWTSLPPGQSFASQPLPPGDLMFGSAWPTEKKMSSSSSFPARVLMVEWKSPETNCVQRR